MINKNMRDHASQYRKDLSHEGDKAEIKGKPQICKNIYIIRHV